MGVSVEGPRTDISWIPKPHLYIMTISVLFHSEINICACTNIVPFLTRVSLSFLVLEVLKTCCEARSVLVSAIYA